ncbi:tyrosine 3-monooxygenase [Parasteatoda tepidariorum]|uniref:tyrosine 3-monooxygenase n=1 Tax=Parasteatoda tepidariorum TaxID=114398 RepID=UPI00077FBA2B|nr:tyrosine 3-monooxygenase [Parasteatoda tepidariorum]
MIATSASFQERISINEQIPVSNRPRRNSLVIDAKLETVKNKLAQEQWIKELKKDEIQFQDLTEEEIVLLSHIADDNGSNKIITNVVFTIEDDYSLLPYILKCIDASSAYIQHLETRVSKKEHASVDVLVKMAVRKNELMKLIKTVRRNEEITITVISNEKVYFLDKWFPKHISDLDKCAHILSKFEPNLDSSHPGYTDIAYRTRRKDIALKAFSYQHGQPIPHVEYTDDEIKTWSAVYKRMKALHHRHACMSYQKSFQLLEEANIYRADAIPQLQDVSTFLKRESGFTLRPAAGLVSARDFLASLAFRVFQCTQYVRHKSSPHHTVEPDCIHELLGHIPMFSDPAFARFSQEIGLASLGASDEEIEKLATVYWFTVEFGLCKEKGDIKAYGAALLSSYGELLNAMSSKPQVLPFDPIVTAVQAYQDQEFQPIYFVAESFEDAKEKVREYVNYHMDHQHHVIYDPYTETIVEIDSLTKLEKLAESIKSDYSTLMAAFRHLK